MDGQLNERLAQLQQSRPDCTFSTSCSSFFSLNENGQRKCEKLKRIFRQCPGDRKMTEVHREQTATNSDSSEANFPGSSPDVFGFRTPNSSEGNLDMGDPHPHGDTLDMFTELNNIMRRSFGPFGGFFGLPDHLHRAPPSDQPRSQAPPLPPRPPPHHVPRGHYGMPMPSEQKGGWKAASCPEEV